MNPKFILRALVTLLGLVTLLVIGWRIRILQKPPQPTYGTVADFSLTDQSGARLSLNDLKNNVWVADFIFTRCQGPCPLITNQMAKLQKKFSAKTALKFVSFSVDSDFDTPPILSKYAATYGADQTRWHFLTGDQKTIYNLIRQSFHLAIEPGADVNFIHSLHFVLVDRGAVIKGYYNSTDPEAREQLVNQLNQLL